jgi:hypothetical protein
MAYYDFHGDFPRYVPVAERKAKAILQAKKLEKRGRVLEPVRLEGKRIAGSFWGKEWCRNLESYMDFSNRRVKSNARAAAAQLLLLGLGRQRRLPRGHVRADLHRRSAQRGHLRGLDARMHLAER